MPKKSDLVQKSLAESRLLATPPNLQSGPGVRLSIDESAPAQTAPSHTALREGEEIVYVEIERLMANPYQPRRGMDEEKLLGLMFSILKNGLWEPLPTRVNPKNKRQHQLALGHQRLESVRRLLAGDLSIGVDVAPFPDLRQLMTEMLDADPAIKGLIGNRVPIVVREYSNQEMAEIAWQENVRRSDLTIPEEGALFLQRREMDNLTQVELARELGVEVTYIKRREAAAKDAEDIQRVWAAKPDSLRTVGYLRQLDRAEDRAPIIQAYLADELANPDQVRDAVEAAKAALTQEENPGTFEGAREHLRDGATAPEVSSAPSSSTLANPPSGTRPTVVATSLEERSSGSAVPAALSTNGSANLEALEADRTRQIREAKLQTALRTLIAYHKDLLNQTATPGEKESKTLSSIETIVGDIKRAKMTN
jgi:ParB-like chromosome segregation protein Spo0J